MQGPDRPDNSPPSSGERDLREAIGTRRVPYGPPTPPAPPYATPPPPPPPSDHTIVTTESGLKWLRTFGRVIDWGALQALSSFITTPIFYLISYPEPADYEELERQLDQNPEDFGALWDFFVPSLAYILISIALYLLFAFLYHYYAEERFGHTFGKKAFGLRIVDLYGGKPTTGQLAGRAVLHTPGYLTPYVLLELIVLMARSDERSLTDVLCGTRVIRQRKVYHPRGQWRGQWPGQGPGQPPGGWQR